jgi:hypothetical protein
MLAARGHCRLRRGAGAPRLRDDRDPCAGPHEAMERLPPCVWLAPMPMVFTAKDLVGRLRECRKLLEGGETEIHTPRTYGRLVASHRLPHHDGRVIDTAH